MTDKKTKTVSRETISQILKNQPELKAKRKALIDNIKNKRREKVSQLRAEFKAKNDDIRRGLHKRSLGVRFAIERQIKESPTVTTLNMIKKLREEHEDLKSQIARKLATTKEEYTQNMKSIRSWEREALEVINASIWLSYKENNIFQKNT